LNTGTATLYVNGNVGIGTTGPANKLDVNGNADIQGGLAVGTTTAQSAGSALFTGTVTAKFFAGNLNATNVSSGQFGANTGGGPYSFTGNVGIGTTAPGQKLSIVGTAGANDMFDVASSTGTSVMRITASGNVGIGTTAPSSILSVGGAGVSGAAIYAAGNLYGVYASDVGSSGGYGVYAVGGSSGYGVYASGGNYGIYAVGSGSSGYGVYASGGSGNDFYGGHGEYTNSSGQWINYSDRRLKTDIVPLSDSLSKIEMLTPVSFKWKDTALMGSQENIGLIAQDVQPVFPEFVSENASGTLGLNYAGFVSPIIGAIKEQQQEIELLKTQNATLQAEVNTLLQKVK
jgi:hypothetical protein